MHIGAAAGAALTLALLSLGAAPGAVARDVPAAVRPTDDIEVSRQAVAALDTERLLSDRDYAAEMLRHLDRLAGVAGDDAQLRAAIESLRLLCLVRLERHQEAAQNVRNLLAQPPRVPEDYSGAIWAALAASDHALLVEIVETASRNVPGVGWPVLREALEREFIGPVLWELREQPPLRVRLAEALLRIGWPGPTEPGGADSIRSILLEDRLGRGDVRAAIDVAAGITSPDTLLPLIVQPRYDAAVAPGRERLALLREVLEAQDRATAEALAASPEDPGVVLSRVHFLRGVGRNEDALALSARFIRDAAATAMASEEGMWIINEAAYSLVALGRNDEALGLMRQLAELPLAEYPHAISGSINYGELLFTLGRTEEALAHATRLQNEAGEHASDYGEMWIASTIACALAQSGRGAAAAPQLERMRAKSEINAAALMHAYLCLGDDDAAAALIVRRLESNDPADAVLALQDYALSRGAAQSGGRYDRLLALRERPEVRVALARVGRVMTLPLARSYWGNF